jgi:predicted nucleic acid-binding protein
LDEVARLTVIECKNKDLGEAWQYFLRRDLQKLSAVDATSFVIMKREKIAVSFSFDHHFAAAGFRLVD